MNLIYQCYIDKSRKTPVKPNIPPDEYSPDVKSLNRLYNDMIMVSTESFKKYADHIGSDYELDIRPEIITKGRDNHSASVYFEWMKVIFDTSYDKYDKIAIFDLDIVANTTENIFEASDAEFYGVNESDYGLCHNEGATWNRCEKTLDLYKKKINRSGFEMIGSVAGERGALTDSAYMHFQGGMYVFSREGRIKARKQFSNWEEWFYDLKGHDPLKHVACLYYDDIYVSCNITNGDFDYEALDPKWMDNPCNYEKPDTNLGIKFMHFDGHWKKRIMCSWALESKYHWVSEYKDNPRRILGLVHLGGAVSKSVRLSFPDDGENML